MRMLSCGHSAERVIGAAERPRPEIGAIRSQSELYVKQLSEVVALEPDPKWCTCKRNASRRVVRSFLEDVPAEDSTGKAKSVDTA